MYKFRLDITVSDETNLTEAYQTLIEALYTMPVGEVDWEIPRKAFKADVEIDERKLKAVIKNHAETLRESETIRYKCSKCEGENVASHALVGLNDDDIYFRTFDGQGYCEDCDEVVTIEQSVIPPSEIESEYH